MGSTKRTELEIEATRTAGETTRRLAAEAGEARKLRGWTQQQLAQRAGLTRPVYGRIERGEVDPTILQLEQIGLALGRRLQVRFGRDVQQLPADAGHLDVQELVLGLGRQNHLAREFELATRPSEPWRSADVVLSGQARRLVLVVECWNVIGDIGAAARSSNRKRREAADLAMGAWGDQATVGLVWVVRAVTRNRVLVARYTEVFRARFPGSSRAWVAALAAGGQPPPADGLVWANPARGRIFEWRQSGPPNAADLQASRRSAIR